MLNELVEFGKTLIELVQKTRQQDEKLKQFDDRLATLNQRVDRLTVAVRELAYQLQHDREMAAKDRESGAKEREIQRLQLENARTAQEVIAFRVSSRMNQSSAEVTGRSKTAAFLRVAQAVAAAAALPVVGLTAFIMVIVSMFAPDWPGMICLLLFLVGLARLLMLVRWEGIVAVACCLLWLVLLFSVTVILGKPGSFRAVYAAYWVVLAANLGEFGRWLWLLPVPRRRAACAVSSLVLGTGLLLRPYWVGTFMGRRANLRGAVLLFADFASADLRGADLTGARVTGAIYDRDTRWPGDFDPETQGARKEEFRIR